MTDLAKDRGSSSLMKSYQFNKVSKKKREENEIKNNIGDTHI
jgi:hypothetical protein